MRPSRRMRRLSSALLSAAGLMLTVVSVSGLQPIEAPHYEPTGMVPHAIAVADFNSDGILDIAVPAAAERKLTVLLGDGKGGFIANHSYPTGMGPSWVEVGDWNGDGKLDLVTANTGEGSLTFYLGDGSGKFTRAQALEWNFQRTLSKVNYKIHTDAIKDRLIPPRVTKSQATVIYATEADLLNVALFGITAAQWRQANPDQTGNMRDAATLEQLVVLSNLESINAVLIHQELKPSERLMQLNEIAIGQMRSLVGNVAIKRLTGPGGKTGKDR